MLATKMVNFWILFTLLLLPGLVVSQKKLAWQEETITDGLTLKSIHTSRLFKSWQNINILQIEDNKHPISLAYSPQKLYPTSYFANKEKALAAINGGFFDMREGGSVTILKANGKMITQNNQTKNPEVMRGVLAIDKEGQLRIETFKSLKAFEDNPDYQSVLITGPILLLGGKKQNLTKKRTFNTKRHPRTCACITQEEELLLITIDGRHVKAEGMSLPELTKFLKLLQCKDAINLDGGGSTTMWIYNQPYKGIVNMPSDNRAFDHAGERRVANALLVH